MKNNETPETLLTQVYNSAKLKKLAIMLVLAGMIICIIPLLPPVQNTLSSFIVAHRPMKSEGLDKLQALLSLPLFAFVVFALAFCCLFSKTISAFLEDAKNTRLITALTAGIAVLLLCFISIFSYQHGAQWLNTDDSEVLDILDN